MLFTTFIKLGNLVDITNAVGNCMTTNIGDLDIIEFLGKGKSGYSYLAQNMEHKYY